MNEKWNLDVIYKGFSDPQYAADCKRVEKKLADLDNQF